MSEATTQTPQEQEENKELFVDVHGIVRVKATGQIAPGHSGNPGGRPKGSYSIMTIIRKKMEEIPPGQVKEWKEQIADKILEKAIVHGDEAMLKLVVQYMDGMPSQKVELGVGEEEVGTLTDFLKTIAKKKDEPKPEQPAVDTGEQPLGEGAERDSVSDGKETI